MFRRDAIKSKQTKIFAVFFDKHTFPINIEHTVVIILAALNTVIIHENQKYK